jgi:hypothetical protein
MIGLRSLSVKTAAALAAVACLLAGSFALATGALTDADAQSASSDPSFTTSSLASSMIPAWTVSCKTSNSALSWAYSPTPQTIANDRLYYCSSDTLYARDLDSGALIAKAQMDGSVSYGSVAPTYADGVIYVALGGGIVEAFDAASLSELWSYTVSSSDSSVDGGALVAGGQSWMSPYVCDGYVYVGWYNGGMSGTGKDGSFVCLKASDGSFVWGQTRTGGYYHSGAVEIGDGYLFITGEDGTSSASENTLSVCNRQTGAVVSSITVAGDVRSVPVYADGAVYFTSHEGYLYRASVDEETGELSGLQSCKLSSTSIARPLIYEGRAYVATYNSLDVVDVSSTSSMSKLFSVKESRGIHATPVLSTARVSSAGTVEIVYAYYTSPGGVAKISIPLKATSSSAAKLTTLYKARGHEQYCNCDIAVGSDGKIYYENDSLTVIALKRGSEVSTVTVNASKVTASVVKRAVKKANDATHLATSATVTKIVLGKKCKSVSAGAFKKYSAVKTVQLGKNVKTLKKGAFKGSKVKTVIVKTKKLKRSRIKGSLRSSKVKTVKVDVGKAKADKRYVKKYKKIFSKKVCGKKVKVKR